MWPCALLALIAAGCAWTGLEPGSGLRHLFLLPALWAAFTAGGTGGALTGLLAGLLQAPWALPAVERLGLTSLTIDGLISLVTPVAFGWVAGRLLDRSRERAARLRAVLDVQRTITRDAPLEQTLREAAEQVRALLRADRVGVVVASSEGHLLAAGAPGPVRLDDASVASLTLRSGRTYALRDVQSDRRIAGGQPGLAPVRGLTVAIDAGTGPAGVLAIERAGELSKAAREAAEEIAMHLALAIENVRLTLRQRQFAGELEAKVAAATERLRALDHAKTEFLSVVAHELRTPLTALEGFSELLLARTVSPERATRFLGHIHTEAGRLGRIVTQLLDVTRIESGRGLELKREHVDLRELIECNIELFATGHPKHRFEWRLAPEADRLSADRDAVDRMLKNLLSNAVKYSPRGGRVAVSASPADDRPGMLELSVEDDGVGIPADDLRRIFNRYVRISHPETAAVRGLGLGLSLVRALAEAHGGRVEVQSLPGKGSRFSLVLPMGEAHFLANFPHSSA